MDSVRKLIRICGVVGLLMLATGIIPVFVPVPALAGPKPP